MSFNSSEELDKWARELADKHTKRIEKATMNPMVSLFISMMVMTFIQEYLDGHTVETIESSAEHATKNIEDSYKGVKLN